ncbi:thiamine pyrophosphate-dependent enzyme [Spirillospora sp. NPDC049652]
MPGRPARMGADQAGQARPSDAPRPGVGAGGAHAARRDPDDRRVGGGRRRGHLLRRRGDVQAVGFQMSAEEEPGQSFTEAGASYMGFATSAVLATAIGDQPWYGVAVTGDGSFTMNPQVLIDGVAHGASGCVVVLDNRRMAAISSLQIDQYGIDHATSDGVAVDYVAWAGSVEGVTALHGGHTRESLREALETARAREGLSLIHVPVYFGDDPAGGLPSYGRWNVGNSVEDTQRLRHEIGL